MNADLKVVTRYNHRWPSTYVPIGQDATVDYPGLDFQFQNNYESNCVLVAKSSVSFENGISMVVNSMVPCPDSVNNLEKV